MAHFALDPVQALVRLQTELDRAIGRPLSGLGLAGASVYPAVNLFTDADGYVLRAEVPGIRPEQLGVQVESGQLTLSGERVAPEGKGSYHRRERHFGRFSRTLPLPSDADPERVEAQARSGVLTVRIHKLASAKPRHVAVKPV
jgi:HSP20 family protein